MSSIVVPTDDAQIKVRLRELKEPICEFTCPLLSHMGATLFGTGLFGEGPADRRMRLRTLVANLGEWGVWGFGG